MTGVLILVHGSREGDPAPAMERLCARVQAQLGLPLVTGAWLRFGPVSLEEGVRRLAAQGADDIKIAPYLLSEGAHTARDIPARLNLLRQEYPALRFTLGAALGEDPRLVQVLADRVREML